MGMLVVIEAPTVTTRSLGRLQFAIAKPEPCGYIPSRLLSNPWGKSIDWLGLMVVSNRSPESQRVNKYAT